MYNLANMTLSPKIAITHYIIVMVIILTCNFVTIVYLKLHLFLRFFILNRYEMFKLTNCIHCIYCIASMFTAVLLCWHHTDMSK